MRCQVPSAFGKYLGIWNFFLTFRISCVILLEHHREVRVIHAGVAELVDARDLKSCVPKERAGSTPVSGTTSKEAWFILLPA